jgi:hypothetical protein
MAQAQGQSENKNARRPGLFGILLIVSVAALFLLTIWGASLLPPLLRYGVWIGLALIPAMLICSHPVAYLYRRSRAGAVLLNLGCANKTTGKDRAGYVFIAIAWFILWVLRSLTGQLDPALVILGFGVVVIWIAIAAARIIASYEPTLLTENGIFGSESIILWGEIESHEWFMQRGDGLLVAKVKGRPWPLDEKKSRVPASLMTEVDRIIAEKCAG